MPRRIQFLPLIAMVITISLASASADAGELWARLRSPCPHCGQSASWGGNPTRHVAAPPGPHRYPEYNAAQAPWYGYGFGVPTYNWGYFGARYRHASLSHKGYYGDFTQWGYRRGY
jgi:hypothetical protein